MIALVARRYQFNLSQEYTRQFDGDGKSFSVFGHADDAFSWIGVAGESLEALYSVRSDR